MASLRNWLVALARERGRMDLADFFGALPPVDRARRSALDERLAQLRAIPIRLPAPADPVAECLPKAQATPLKAAGIGTLGELAARMHRRVGWWRAVPGIGATGARTIAAFLHGHPTLVQAGRALATVAPAELAPWKRIRLPRELDGSAGRFRAPPDGCVLAARNDYEAIQAWLSLQEAKATERAYRKEAERLLLRAIVQQAKPLFSLTTEDAIAYRAFLRRPTPRARWVASASHPRTPLKSRPFLGPLSARSAGYALSVLGALFGWLVEQRYLLANPFAGTRVKAAAALRATPIDASRAFADHEWTLVRAAGDRVTPEHGSDAAAERLRFVLDFGFGTGLRAAELCSARLGDIDHDEEGSHRWISVAVKGGKLGRVAAPPLAALALDWYLAQRGLSVPPQRLEPATPLLPQVPADGKAQRALTPGLQTLSGAGPCPHWPAHCAESELGTAAKWRWAPWRRRPSGPRVRR